MVVINLTCRLAMLVVALSHFAAARQVEAQESPMTLTGAKLLEACLTPDKEWISFCNGYIQAAFDADSSSICPPSGTTRDQAFEIIIPALQQAPELQKLNALSAVGLVLRTAYPCK